MSKDLRPNADDRIRTHTKWCAWCGEPREAEHRPTCQNPERKINSLPDATVTIDGVFDNAAEEPWRIVHMLPGPGIPPRVMPCCGQPLAIAHLVAAMWEDVTCPGLASQHFKPPGRQPEPVHECEPSPYVRDLEAKIRAIGEENRRLRAAERPDERMPLDPDWVEALRLASRLWAGYPHAVTNDREREGFIDTAEWFRKALRNPPG